MGGIIHIQEKRKDFEIITGPVFPARPVDGRLGPTDLIFSLIPPMPHSAEL